MQTGKMIGVLLLVASLIVCFVMGITFNPNDVPPTVFLGVVALVFCIISIGLIAEEEKEK